MLHAARCLLLASALASCSSPFHREGALGARRAVSLDVVEFSGRRYVVPVHIEGALAVPLMVHGNSSMYLSLTHEIGALVNRGPVAKTEDYGYSARGKGIIRIGRIRVGDETFQGHDSVPVFDFAEENVSPFKGMVGLPFLRASRAAIDFRRDELLLGVAHQDEPDRSLIEGGYRWTALTPSAGGRVTIQARFAAIERTLAITPSTVSSALTLHLPLFARTIPMAKEASPDRSPHGTTPDEFRADNVAFEIEGVAMTSRATFEDFAEYGKVSDAELESFGMLGFDWMKAHDAVLDYANLRLYFKP